MRRKIALPTVILAALCLLLAAPHMDEAPAFDKEENGLHRVAVDEWDGHLFVNLSGTAEPLASHVGDLAPKFAALS